MTKTANCVIGAQWGDEGKGKLVDILAQKADIVARYNGGANAGHTIVHEGRKYKLNLLPSGIIHKHTVNVIGNGVVLHVPHFFEEIENLGDVDVTGRLLVSDRAHMLFDFHQIIDGLQEKSLGKDSIGTTKKGIGPCYSTRAERTGLRVGDIRHWKHFEENLRALIAKLTKRHGFEYDADAEVAKYKVYREKLLPMITDTVHYMNTAIDQGKRVLIEGANAVLLDLDFGTYPFVTSSNPSVGGCCTGLGVPPKKIGEVYGVVKAYTTRVGSGPFPTELLDNVGEHLRSVGCEFGTTTGRARRCGWFDLPVCLYSDMINAYTAINLTKLDVLTGLDELKIGVAYYAPDGSKVESFPSQLETLANVKVEYETLPGWKEDISKCRRFEQLPVNCQNYVLRLEKLLNVPIRWIGVGPDRDDIVSRE